VENNKIYQEYLQLKKADNIFFGGRLGNYQYLNMDETISRALKLVKELLG
jgi:UDP-galactopyranose mutase